MDKQIDEGCWAMYAALVAEVSLVEDAELRV